MHRTNGDDMYADEAREALADRGFHPLEKCEMLPYDIQKQQGMSRSVLVKLKKFDPSKELQSVSHLPASILNPRLKLISVCTV